MRRPWLIILAGLILAVGAYWGSYRAASSSWHAIETSQVPELAWLKAEFHLSDAEFARVSALHDGYLAGCAERCRQIDQKNTHLKHLLAMTNAITPEIERTLTEAALLRAECYKQMLDHFYQVSRTMPPEQGKRYLNWVQNRTILLGAHQGMQAGATHTHMH